jgi:hypothetical protein
MILLPLIAASLASAPIAAADKADLRCVGIFAMMAGEDTEEEAGMTGAIMYYIGRIEGRGSGLDLDRGLGAALDELFASREMVEAEAKRCGSEMVAKGEQIQRIGSATATQGKGQSGKN